VVSVRKGRIAKPEFSLPGNPAFDLRYLMPILLPIHLIVMVDILR
jgi:hypothetical protein